MSALGGSAWDAKIREHLAPLVWAEVVGPQVAGATEVIEIRGGVLKVATRTAVWSHELAFYKADILRRLNARVGTPAGGAREPVIVDILFQNRGSFGSAKHGTVPPPAPLAPSPDELDDVSLSPAEEQTIDQGLAAITDNDLRARLRRVRLADARLRTWRLDNGWLPCERCGDLAPPLLAGTAGNACARCRIERAPPAAAFRPDDLLDDTPAAAPPSEDWGRDEAAEADEPLFSPRADSRRR